MKALARENGRLAKLVSEVVAELLEDNNLSPIESQDDPMVEEKRKEIIDQVAEGDRTKVSRNLIYTLYDEETTSWGIATAPSRFTVVYRIKNPKANKLQQACTRLVRVLHSEQLPIPAHFLADLKVEPDAFSNAKNPPQKATIRLVCTERIDVLEPGREDHSFFGKIVPVKFQMVMREKRFEASGSMIAAVMSVGLFIVTSPAISPYLFTVDSWIKEVLSRVAASLIGIALTLALNVLLPWLYLKNKRQTIQWDI